MKLLFSLLLVFTLTSSFCQHKKSIEASRYNDFIIEKQHEVASHLADFFGIMDTASLEMVKKKRIELAKLIDKEIEEIKALKPYKGDKKFRDGAVELMIFYRSSLEDDYERMIHLIADRDRSEEDHQKLREYVQELIKKEEEIDSRFASIQEEFAKRHHLELIPHPEDK